MKVRAMGIAQLLLIFSSNILLHYMAVIIAQRWRPTKQEVMGLDPVKAWFILQFSYSTFLHHNIELRVCISGTNRTDDEKVKKIILLGANQVYQAQNVLRLMLIFSPLDFSDSDTELSKNQDLNQSPLGHKATILTIRHSPFTIHHPNHSLF